TSAPAASAFGPTRRGEDVFRSGWGTARGPRRPPDRHGLAHRCSPHLRRFDPVNAAILLMGSAWMAGADTTPPVAAMPAPAYGPGGGDCGGTGWGGYGGYGGGYGGYGGGGYYGGNAASPCATPLPAGAPPVVAPPGGTAPPAEMPKPVTPGTTTPPPKTTTPP